MQLKKLIFCMFFICSVSYGKIISPQTPNNSIRSGPGLMYIQGPDLTRTGRYSFNILYQKSFYPLLKSIFNDQLSNFFRGEVDLILAPDTTTKSQRVNVINSYYLIYPSIGGCIPFYFRFFFNLGPTFIYETSKITFDSTSYSSSDTQIGLLGKAGVDYAFNKNFEFSIDAGLHKRFKDDKLDWFIEFLFGFNL